MAKHTDAIRKHLGGNPTDPIEVEIAKHLDAIDADMREMVEALERITRVASVELSGKRDDVLEQARAILSKAKD